jgi:hypothetical protein
MAQNNEMLTTSTVCSNTNKALKEALPEQTIAIVVDLGARAVEMLPPGIDHGLALTWWIARSC